MSETCERCHRELEPGDEKFCKWCRRYSEFVHEYVDEEGRTRYVVARHVGGWYIAPLTAFGCLRTGAGWLAGRRAIDVASSITHTYACRRDAILCARILCGVLCDDDED